MTDIKNICISDFDYELPDERIAKFPLAHRDESKLLIYRSGQISEAVFKQLPDCLPADALLVFNNTQVIQARLIFRKATGAHIEIFCLEPKEPADYALAFSQQGACVWNCLTGNAKRWKEGKLTCRSQRAELTAEKLRTSGELHEIRFEWSPPDWTFADVLEHFGELPIPPYLHRKTEESDKQNYQTVYSKIKGSVAAPTAGLHFTPAVLNALKNKGVKTEDLTLHVGAGTFKPVKSTTLEGHEMHTETFSVKKSTIAQLIENEGHIYAVGTTSVRTLESLYFIGAYLKSHPDASPDALAVGQWMPYSQHEQTTGREALSALLASMDRLHLDILTSHTQIMIAPGYRFRIVSGMLTNFHQPKSTLLLLISAFIGDAWRKVYDYALRNDFRFLSYGDSSLLEAQACNIR
ncbi:MAG: S-adenosylmethionine:tRNA ribosyltransferase-isomerase [Candidatus Symbiothrix sp.]|jgi:S-adenosylmethionine:tRNA ribosyltransferase-isomerase|nr:S-adenosylmethionine:tRNA ribosyltransferase-isomerase [Candidatus Symbiothrix sp.]